MFDCGDGIARLECLPCPTLDHFGNVMTKQFKFGLIRPDDLPPVCLRVVQIVMGELEALPEVSLSLHGRKNFQNLLKSSSVLDYFLCLSQEFKYFCTEVYVAPPFQAVGLQLFQVLGALSTVACCYVCMCKVMDIRKQTLQ